MRIVRVDSRPGVWYRQDIANALQGVCDAANGVLSHVPDTLEARSYQAGFTNAIASTAAGFGLAVRFSIVSSRLAGACRGGWSGNDIGCG